MSYENGNTKDVGQFNGLVSTPAVLAGLLLLFFSATTFADDAMIDTGKLVILPVAAATAAVLGRIWVSALPDDSVVKRTSVFSVLVAISTIALEALGFIDAILATTFAFMAISTLILVKSNRNEEATILFTMVAGFHVSVAYAATMPELTLSEGATLQNLLIDVQRAGIAANFFAFYVASMMLGTILAIAFRGILYGGGIGPLFERLPSKIGFSGHRDIVITGIVLLLVNLVPLYSLATISDASAFEEHHYLGGVWALVTSIVVLFVSFCRAERWHVLGSVVAVNWLIYTLSHMVEIGVSLPEQLEFLAGNDFGGAFSWFFITFWLNVLAIMLASSGRFGEIAPRREPSEFRLWWRDNSYSILVGSAVLVGLLIRTGWNVLPAMNANVTGLWDMTGGSDPWYMKRVVDYIVAEHSHFIFDADRSYPSGGINPRPPLFSWCLALGGLALEWLTGITADEIVWWSVAGFPAIFGALIVLPVSGIANRLHSSQAGIVAAWLMALMPGHVSHSTFGLADHDSFALLFLTMAFYFWVRALGEIGSERIFRNPSPNPLYLIAGIREMWNRNAIMMSYATLAGISFSTVALGWKGFVYGPGILFLAFAFQIVLNMFRRRDSLPLTSAALQMMLTTFLIPLPFYIWPGLNLLWAPSGFQPMFYIVGFTIALGWVASSFRDKPWLLVLGSGVLLFGGILSALWVLQTAEIYDGWDILFTGGFYFSKNKIFGTIGEAQAPSRGVLFASYGPIVTLIALGYAFILLWRGAREEKQG
ncbi:MAG: STT3 domain-containing protein, partial [Candidatus Thermoplasmatota archaeon]|nr:STT3 domain-containing protein [Candidatus Thermoplasmatota archaeon]